MRIYVSGPFPKTDEEVAVYTQAAHDLAEAGYVPVMPYWFYVDVPESPDEARRSASAMLLSDGVAMVLRNASGRRVSAERSVAKDMRLQVHTLQFWLGHHPSEYHKP